MLLSLLKARCVLKVNKSCSSLLNQQYLMDLTGLKQWEVQSVLYKDWNKGTAIELIRHGEQRLIRKQITLNSVTKSYAMRELQFMKEISHPNVVPCIHSQIQDKTLIIYMPYYLNSDLQNFLTRYQLTFEERLNMFIDILVGLHQLHSRFIIHRDIKLKNIFLTAEKKCVIGDLGIATTALDSATSEVGTYCYNAPEIYSKEGPYTEKVDVWAVGMIAYQLFNSKRDGKIPFPFLPPQKMIKQITKNGSGINYPRYLEITKDIYPCDKELPSEIQEMIRRMLDNDPSSRIGWKQLYQQNLLGKFDVNERLCTFKAEYLHVCDIKTSLKCSLQKVLSFKEKHFFKLRHVLNVQNRKYFQKKYPLFKQEIPAFYRVYLRLMKECIDCYNEIRERKVYKYATKLKPFYKLMAQELFNAETFVNNCNKNEKKQKDYTSNIYFYSKWKIVAEVLDEMDEQDFRDMLLE